MPFFLVYTRRGADNDHIMRNRAPLFMAQVDPVRMQVLRGTERVLIPERGALAGEFRCLSCERYRSVGDGFGVGERCSASTGC